VFQNDNRESGDYGVKGTLEAWQEGVAYHAAGNPTLAFALSCAFVGPLLKLCGSENGGVHLFGDSSTGKTTLVKAATSVFGSPRHMRTWNATANGIESVAELFNDNLLPLDEIGQCQPKHVGDTVYALMNGTGKQRANQIGGARNTKLWRLFVLSSGERTVATRMAEGGIEAKAGQEIRLLNLSVKRTYGIWDNLGDFEGNGDGAALSAAVVQAASDNYGTAGIEFLKRLTADNETDWRERWKEFAADDRFKSQSTDGQDERVAGRFALVAMAGEMAAAYGILPLSPGLATMAAAEMFATWKKDRGVVGNSESVKMVERIRDFVEKNPTRFDLLAKR
jgi:putative DNA primase/helicase